MPSYLITGSSRGLGLSIVAELLKAPENKVIATARNTKKSAGLQDLAAKYPADRLALVDLDVTSEESIAAAVEQVTKILGEGEGLDHLISNAGVNNLALIPFDEVDLAAFKIEIDFSLVSTILLLRGFLPLIRKSNGAKKILQMSSVLGSVELGGYTPGLTPTYAVGKAALNMLLRKWGASLKAEGITTLLVHPGWIKATDIGAPITEWMEKYAPDTKDITLEEGAAGVVSVLNAKTAEDSGSFFNYDGTKLPW